MLGECKMKKLTRLSLILCVSLLTLGMVYNVRAQSGGGSVETFFDSEVPGITIQVNATAEVRPAENLTVWLSLVPETNVYVYVERFMFEVYGFVNGTAQAKSIGSLNETDFPLNGMLNDTSEEYSKSFTGNLFVPSDIWGTTFGNVTLDYTTPLISPINTTSGFYMTTVENTFLENLQSQLNDLNESYNQLNNTYNNLTSTYLQLNQTFLQLQDNYTTLQKSANELGTTRQVAVILAITTALFVVTTVFMVMRRPREK